MLKLKIISLHELFCIQDAKSKLILDEEGDFSVYSVPALLFNTESSAWNYLIRKRFVSETEFIGFIKKPFNFEDRLIPLFEAMKAGKIIKSVTCYSGEINKDNREKDFIVQDFFAEYYCVSIASNYDQSKNYDLVNSYNGAADKKEVQFYMNWVIDFELYNN